jgi:hypothetical protein
MSYVFRLNYTNSAMSSGQNSPRDSGTARTPCFLMLFIEDVIQHNSSTENTEELTG